MITWYEVNSIYQVDYTEAYAAQIFSTIFKRLVGNTHSLLPEM